MKSFSPTILALWAISLLSVGFVAQQAQAQGPITGDITWAGGVSLNNTSAATATTVTAWHSQANPDTGLPEVQSVDGDFVPFINVGDGTLFHAPWSFNSGSITNFWSVGGFQFDLTVSNGTQGGTPGVNGFAIVTGTGLVSGHGFTATPGIFRFSTQDPGAGSPQVFSFSASTSVPEPTTVALFGIGAVCLMTRMLARKKPNVG